MKFINYLEKITGVDVFALTAFGIFFSIFIIMLIWALKADRQLIKKINYLPLDN